MRSCMLSVSFELVHMYDWSRLVLRVLVGVN